MVERGVSASHDVSGRPAASRLAAAPAELLRAGVTFPALLRLLVSAAGALIAASWLDLGGLGCLVAGVGGFAACATPTARAVIRSNASRTAAALERSTHAERRGEPTDVPILPIYFAGR